MEKSSMLLTVLASVLMLLVAASVHIRFVESLKVCIGNLLQNGIVILS